MSTGKSTCCNQNTKIIHPKKANKKVADAGNKATNKPKEDEIDSGELAKINFDQELRWCIEKLQSMIVNSNLSQKQIEAKAKALHVLNDSKACMIKKRSVMRTTLGEYRSQMKQEEQKYLKECKNIKVIPVAACNQKGTYIKKCCKVQPTNTEHQFRFNFPLGEGPTDSS